MNFTASILALHVVSLLGLIASHCECMNITCPNADDCKSQNDALFVQ